MMFSQLHQILRNRYFHFAVIIFAPSRQNNERIVKVQFQKRDSRGESLSHV